MTEEILEISEQQRDPTDPPTKGAKLYKNLIRDGYTVDNLGTEEEFTKALSDKNKATTIYQGLIKDGYTVDNIGELDQFVADFIPAEIEPPVKKKGSISFEKSSLDYGNTISSPSQLLSKDEGGNSLNPIDLVKTAQELGSKTVSRPLSTGSTFGMGSTGNSIDEPDQEAIKQSKKIKENFKKIYGIDADDFFVEIRDLPDFVYKQNGFTPEELVETKKANPQNYQRRIATAKFQTGIREAINAQFDKGAIDENEKKVLLNNVFSNQENSKVGDYGQQRQTVQSQMNLIENFGGEGRDKLKKELTIDRAKIYGDSYKNDGEKYLKQDPASKYLSNYGVLAYQFLKDTDPETAKGYASVLIDPEKIKNNQYAKIGWEEKMSRLESIGIGLQQSAVQEDLNDLAQIAQKQGGLTEDQQKQAAELTLKSEELNEAMADLNVKYENPFRIELEEATQELVGQKYGGLTYLAGKTAQAFENTAQGIATMAKEPFISNESSVINQLAAAGELSEEESMFYKTQKKSALQSFQLQLEPDLKAKVDAILNNDDLSRDEKYKQIYPLLRENPDQWAKVPIKGGKINLTPSSLFYSIADLASTLAPYMVMEVATGGGATASLGRKLISSFTAAATTGFQDAYAQAVRDGVANPFSHALRVTAINSAAMAGAGTPDIVRKMLGTKTAIGKIVNKMTDDEILSFMKTKSPSISKFGKTFEPLKGVKSVGKAVGEGLKGGAKFETIMGGAQVLNDKMSGIETDPEELFKKALVGTLAFGAFGGMAGARGQYKKLNQIEKSSLYKAGQQPEFYLDAATQQLRDGIIDRKEFENIKINIDKASKLVDKVDFVDNKGNELSENEKAELLTLKIEEADLKERQKKDIPEKLKEKLDEQIEEVNTEINEVYSGKWEKENFKEPYPSERKEEDTKLSEPIEGLDEQGVPVGDNVPPPVEIRDGVAIESPTKIPEPITIKPENEVKAEVSENTIKSESEGIVNTEANQVKQPAEKGSPIEKTDGKSGEQTKEDVKQPSEVPSPKIFAEAKRTILSFRGLQEIATEYGLEDVKPRDRKSDLQLLKDAETTVNKWVEEKKYGTEIESLVEKAENNEPISDEQRIILQQHIANVRGQAEALRGKEGYDAKLEELNRVKMAGQKSRSAAGAALRVADFASEAKPSMEDWMLQKMEANNVDQLTENQKKEVERQFKEYEDKLNNADSKIQLYEEKIAELEAKQALSKQYKLAKIKKTKEDFANERKTIKEKLLQEVENYKQSINKVGISSDGGVESFIITAKMAKLIGQFVKSYADELGANLEAVTSKVFEEVKDFMQGITKKDIHDVISGKYAEKKELLTKLVKDLKDLKTEAALINQLEVLMQGGNVKSERKKIADNQKIKELKEKIKGFKKENPDVNEQLSSLKSRLESQTEKIYQKIKSGEFESSKKEKFDPNTVLKKADPKLWKETMDALIARDEAKDKFDYEIKKDELAKRSKVKKVLDFGAKLIATSRAIKAGIDDSATFVQLGMTVLANPKSAAKAKLKAIQAISDKNFKRQLADVHNSPYWEVIKESGLDITEPKSLTKEKTEELFSDNLLNQEFIKIKGKKYNPWTYTGGIFERMFTSMGNNMRLNLFLKRAEQLQNDGKSFKSHPQEFKDAARVINELTGRGKMNKYLEMASPAITPIIWAPKMLASSLNLLGVGDIAYGISGKKGFYGNLTPAQRKYALSQMGKGIGMGVSIMAIAAMNGAEIDYDPQSVTFGTIKAGDKRYNVFGRYASMAKTLVQLATGKRKVKEEVQDLDESGGRKKMLGRFFRGKMTPFAGVAYDYILNSKKNTFTKEPINLQTLPDELLTPISLGDLKKDLERDGTISLLTKFLPAFEGIQVSDERDYEKK